MSFTLCLSLDSVILRGTLFFDFLVLSLRSVVSGRHLFLITLLDWMPDTFLDPTGRPMALFQIAGRLINPRPAGRANIPPARFSQ